MGADAAFDIGMSHPDLFAGVIPICGIIDAYCKWYWENAKHVSWYIVAGQLDRNSLDRNAGVVNRMIRHGREFDMIYAEYINRGYEPYYEEIHRLFDWMDQLQRTKYPKEVEATILRAHEDRFYWVEADGFPERVTQSNVLARGGKRRGISPMELSANVSPGNTVRINDGAKRYTIWLSPDFVEFERRVTVMQNGHRVFRGFIRPDIATILEDLRRRGDRQKSYSYSLVID
jgi:hypothetical protein